MSLFRRAPSNRTRAVSLIVLAGLFAVAFAAGVLLWQAPTPLLVVLAALQIAASGGAILYGVAALSASLTPPHRR